MGAIGDRYGIYEAMTEAGPVTPTELAQSTGISEQYVQQWLETQTAGDYMHFDSATSRYCLWCNWPQS